MLFDVSLTRSNGCLLAKNAQSARTASGLLFVEERQDEHLKRGTLTATLCDRHTKALLLPTLFDVRLTHFSPTVITLSGWERVALQPDRIEPWRECGQSWVLRPSSKVRTATTGAA